MKIKDRFGKEINAGDVISILVRSPDILTGRVMRIENGAIMLNLEAILRCPTQQEVVMLGDAIKEERGAGTVLVNPGEVVGILERGKNHD